MGLFCHESDFLTVFLLSGNTTLGSVRFWEPSIRILLLRVSRDDCARVRAALTVWTQLERIMTTTTTAMDRYHKNSHQPPLPQQRKVRIVASTLSVNGSARTAKRSAILYVRKWYHKQILQQLTKPKANSITSTNTNNNNKTNPSIMPTTHRRFLDQECRKLQDVLSSIQAID